MATAESKCAGDDVWYLSRPFCRSQAAIWPAMMLLFLSDIRKCVDVYKRQPVEYEWLIGKFQFHDGFFLVKLFEIEIGRAHV